MGTLVFTRRGLRHNVMKYFNFDQHQSSRYVPENYVHLPLSRTKLQQALNTKTTSSLLAHIKRAKDPSRQSITTRTDGHKQEL